MKKWLICLLAALLLTLPAGAEEPLVRDETWFYPMLYAPGSRMHLLTDAQLETIAQLPSEDVHALVEAMFLAATGVEEKAEIALWKTLRKQEEKDARSLETAAYRVRTLPWLLEAYAPGNRPEYLKDATPMPVRPTATPVPAPTATPVPTPVPTASPVPEQMPEPTPTVEPEVVYTVEDSWAAFAANPFGQEYLAMLAEQGGADLDTAIGVMQAIVQRWLAEIDHADLERINSDYQLWLYAPATPIDYPVAQCRDNSYYLDHLLNRKSNRAGTLFIDYRNLADLKDPNTLIYGHHMRDSSMFHSLTDFETPGFFHAHPFMVAVLPREIYVIELFSGYVTDSSDHCYDLAISDEKDMRAFVERAERKSNFDAHGDVNCRKDRLVTLSTCAYNFENARYVAIGRLDLAWKRDLYPKAE